MKKTNFVFLALLILNVFFFYGCASNTTRGYASTLEEAHPNRMEKTVIGMSLNDFKSVWPEATRKGISENGEIYEFVYTHLVAGVAYDYKIYTSFYFTDNKLTKYESNKGM